MNILIVDDIAAVLKLLRITLEAEGHTIIEATDGVHALEILDRSPVDAIISDILMPRMDGYRLCYEVRRQQKFSRLPFVFYNSTYTSPTDEKLARDFGADEFFKRSSPIKPILEAITRIAASAEVRLHKPPNALEELAVVKEYSEALVIKLEQNNYELEQTSDRLIQANSELVMRTKELEQAEQELSRINESLEIRVGERTVQLEAANKVLVVANEQLEAFGYSLTHDLASPLSAMGLAAEMLQEDQVGLKNEQQTLLKCITDGSHRMRKIIDSMLILSGLGHNDLVLHSVDLSAVAQEILEDLRRSDPVRKVEAIVAPGMCIHGDAQLLRMVWENLLRNAWKFTRKTEGAKIEVGSQHQNGKTVYFVRDNGVGFSMANAGKIFQAFHRLHSQADFPGTGIGLAIVQRIIDRHAGRIWAESNEGKGATFYFSLPPPA